MRTFLSLLVLLGAAGRCCAGTMVTQPGNLANYIAVQFVPNEDQPTIKADGLTTTNGYVWVEKADPVFYTEFTGYDYPFAEHDLSAFTALSSGVIEVGFGKSSREMKYFGDDWAFFPWSASPPSSAVPEPSAALLAILGVVALIRRK